ncbi:hypothetical protein GCM10010381_68100 [Streptomyces xantholiticus]|nr:hypothetical protein GCM10010381_68100 [Streptomyces xantholiticus]
MGTGGQGTVYEAYDPEGSRVALKLLHATGAEDSEVARRLSNEVAAARRVSTACTARLIEAVVDGPLPHVVSEFIDGPNVREAVREHGSYRGDDLHRLALAIAVALCGIHDAQVVHRDLKPDNVLLGCSGPVVIDFGVARLMDLTATQPAGIAGTPAYTAPEVFDGRPAGPAADVFAWGAVVLFAATGRDPFGGEHLGQIASRVRGGRHDRSMLSEPLRSLVGSALDEDPARRPGAMGLLYALTSRPGQPSGQDGEWAVAEGTRQARLLRPPPGLPGPLLPLGDVAEHAFTGLSAAEQDAAREVFLRMVVPGDDPAGARDTVRSVALEELSDDDAPGRAASVRGALTAFTAAGLLTGADGEVSTVGARSSALVVAWPRLRSWIADDREGLRIHRRLGEGARYWQAHARKDDALAQGTELDRTVEWSTTAPAHLRLSSLEQAYLATAQRVRRRRRAQRRRLTATALVLAFLAVVSATVAWNLNALSEERRTRLERERTESAARRAASRADALRRFDPMTAMLLNVAAWRIAPLDEARSGLLAAATQQERDELLVSSAAGLMWSHDGGTIADVEVGRARITVRDAATGRSRGTLSFTGGRLETASPVMSADGSVLAVPTASGVRLWRPPSPSFAKRTYGTPASHPVAVTSDSGTLVVQEGDELHVWDTATGRRTATVPVTGQAPGMALSPDGSRLAVCVWREAVKLWDARTGRRVAQPLLRGAIVEDCRMGFSPDSRVLATAVEVTQDERGVANGTGNIRLWDARTGAAGPPIALSYHTDLSPRAAGRASFAFSPDSRLLGIAERSTITVHHIAGDATVAQYALPKVDSVPVLNFGPDSRTLRYLTRGPLTSGQMVIRTVAWRPPAEQYGGGPHRGAVFSGDGTRLAVIRETGNSRPHPFVELRDTANGRVVGKPFPTNKGTLPSGVSLSRDGRTLIVAGEGTATVWDTERHRIVAELRPVDIGSNRNGWHAVTSGVVLAPDGKRVATHERESLLLWTVSDGRVSRSIPKVHGVPLAFTPEGVIVVTNAGEIVDTRTGAVRKPFGETIERAAVSNNGRVLAAAEAGGTVYLWDLERGRSIGAVTPDPEVPLGRHGPAAPREIALSADGRTLVTASVQGGPAELWDTSTLRRTGDAILQSTRVSGLAFAARTGRLMTASDSGITGDDSTPLLESYAFAPEAIATAVCAEAGRSLSPQEWDTHIPNVRYRKICP